MRSTRPGRGFDSIPDRTSETQRRGGEREGMRGATPPNGGGGALVAERWGVDACVGGWGGLSVAGVGVAVSTETNEPNPTPHSPPYWLYPSKVGLYLCSQSRYLRTISARPAVDHPPNMNVANRLHFWASE